MNAFTNPPVVRNPAHAENAFPCVWCWGKRFAMTTHLDHHGYPTCPDCAGRLVKTLGMPSFVIAHVLETMQ